MALRDVLDSNLLRPRNLVPVGATVLIAVFTWIGIQDLLIGGDEPAAPVPAQPLPPPPAVEQPAEPAAVEPAPVFPKLLVTRRDIGPGVMLVSELVEWREWRDPIDLNMAVLQDTVPLQAILGSVTRQPYAEGTPIAWDGIITPGGPGFIGAVLRPNMRAVTVEVDRATTTANIIYPGDRVDVIMVAERDSGPGPAAQAIVRDVRVVAVGSTIFALGRYGRAKLAKAGAIEPVSPPAGENYTLEVFPVDAERIALAVSTGRLTLAMRSVAAPRVDDRGYEIPPPVRLGEVLIEPKSPPPPPTAPPIRIIRGTVSEETVTVGS